MNYQKQSWHEYYREKLTIPQFLTNLNAHSILFEKITEENPNRMKVLEVGVGTGSMSIFLSWLGYEVVGIDNNKKVLEQAKRNVKRFNGKVKLVLCDAFFLSEKFGDEFDVAFSQGLLEHFNDEEISSLVDEQLKVAKTVYFSVPSYFYPQQDFGNERLMTVEEWKTILKKFNLNFIDYYLPSIVWLKKIKQNPLVFLKRVSAYTSTNVSFAFLKRPVFIIGKISR
jgi:SAM-dependent methyltransferase